MLYEIDIIRRHVGCHKIVRIKIGSVHQCRERWLYDFVVVVVVVGVNSKNRSNIHRLIILIFLLQLIMAGSIIVSVISNGYSIRSKLNHLICGFLMMMMIMRRMIGILFVADIVHIAVIHATQSAAAVVLLLFFLCLLFSEIHQIGCQIEERISQPCHRGQ